MQLTVIGSYAKALVMTTGRLPVEGETVLGREYRETYGGKGSDMAVQAARLGAHVHYLGAVGTDEHGTEFASLLTAEGIDDSRLLSRPDRPTGVGFILKDDAGRNLIAVDMGANETFTPADVDAAADLVRSADVVLAQLEIPQQTALHALRVAREAGVSTVLNPAPAVDLRSVDLTMVDVLTPNETEARVALGLDPQTRCGVEELAARLLDLGPRAVVITRGETGALVHTAQETTEVAGFSVDVVDSNGAGDSFNAALAVALGEGQTLAEAARFACVVAALSCEHWETVPSYRTRDQVAAATGVGPIRRTNEER